ncbi:MAG: pentapeptide repeat-containing protein [Pirellulaceae bacterium]
MSKPQFLDDEAFRHLRAADFESYDRATERRQAVDFTGADLRGVDFRSVDSLNKIILRDAYLRDVDFRGCDLRQVDLTGASIHNAKIAGVYFADNLTPLEIQLSIQHGTRLRTSM